MFRIGVDSVAAPEFLTLDGGMWGAIVLAPDYCLSVYFVIAL